MPDMYGFAPEIDPEPGRARAIEILRGVKNRVDTQLEYLQRFAGKPDKWPLGFGRTFDYRGHSDYYNRISEKIDEYLGPDYRYDQSGISRVINFFTRSSGYLAEPWWSSPPMVAASSRKNPELGTIVGNAGQLRDSIATGRNALADLAIHTAREAEIRALSQLDRTFDDFLDSAAGKVKPAAYWDVFNHYKRFAEDVKPEIVARLREITSPGAEAESLSSYDLSKAVTFLKAIADRADAEGREILEIQKSAQDTLDTTSGSPRPVSEQDIIREAEQRVAASSDILDTQHAIKKILSLHDDLSNVEDAVAPIRKERKSASAPAQHLQFLRAARAALATKWNARFHKSAAPAGETGPAAAAADPAPSNAIDYATASASQILSSIRQRLEFLLNLVQAPATPESLSHPPAEGGQSPSRVLIEFCRDFADEADNLANPDPFGVRPHQPRYLREHELSLLNKFSSALNEPRAALTHMTVTHEEDPHVQEIAKEWRALEEDIARRRRRLAEMALIDGRNQNVRALGELLEEIKWRKKDVIPPDGEGRAVMENYVQFLKRIERRIRTRLRAINPLSGESGPAAAYTVASVARDLKFYGRMSKSCESIEPAIEELRKAATGTDTFSNIAERICKSQEWLTRTIADTRSILSKIETATRPAFEGWDASANIRQRAGKFIRQGLQTAWNNAGHELLDNKWATAGGVATGIGTRIVVTKSLLIVVGLGAINPVAAGIVTACVAGAAVGIASQFVKSKIARTDLKQGWMMKAAICGVIGGEFGYGIAQGASHLFAGFHLFSPHAGGPNAASNVTSTPKLSAHAASHPAGTPKVTATSAASNPASTPKVSANPASNAAGTPNGGPGATNSVTTPEATTPPGTGEMREEVLARVNHGEFNRFPGLKRAISAALGKTPGHEDWAVVARCFGDKGYFKFNGFHHAAHNLVTRKAGAAAYAFANKIANAAGLHDRMAKSLERSLTYLRKLPVFRAALAA